MPGQRARSAVAADERSALPSLPGIPWWGAVLLAATFAAIGFAFDAGTGSKELSAVFAVCYVTGCLLAVLAVRQSGVFTAVVQPPLILFFVVPGAYFLFHDSTINGLKDIVINCGYPLIERFPLMFITAGAVLVVGMIRWYLGVSARRTGPAAGDDVSQPRASGGTGAAETTVMDAVDAVDAAPRRKRRDHSASRPSRATTAANAEDDLPRRPRRPARTPAAGSTRSRHVRPPEPEVDYAEPPAARPRRRPAQAEGPPVDAPEPRRRPRTTPSREAREPRRNLPPIDGHSAYERPERTDRPLRPDRAERPARRRRPPSSYDPYESYESSPTSGATNGSHHPISRVRYRGDDPESQAESRAEHRTQPRRHRDADSWEFDV